MSNGQWTGFRQSITLETNALGIENFRKFPTVCCTMRGSYIHIAQQFISPTFEKYLRDNCVVEDDFDNLANQFMHFSIFNSLSKLYVHELTSIVEFGGGCGYMCHLMKLLGFTGDYYIYDFPEVHNIQKYYLESVKQYSKVHLITEPNPHADLFIGCWSVSESTPRMPMKTYPADTYWVAYQEEFDGVSNHNFFMNEFSDCEHTNALHHNQSKYLVGKL